MINLTFVSEAPYLDVDLAFEGSRAGRFKRRGDSLASSEDVRWSTVPPKKPRMLLVLQLQSSDAAATLRELQGRINNSHPHMISWLPREGPKIDKKYLEISRYLICAGDLWTWVIR